MTKLFTMRLQVNSYPGQLVPILTATHTALDWLVIKVVYMTIYCLYCLTAMSAFSKCNFGICCHLLGIQNQTDVMVKLFKSLVRPSLMHVVYLFYFLMFVYMDHVSELNLMWCMYAYCTLAWSLHYKNRKTDDWKSAKNSLRCYLNLKAQSMKKHLNKLTGMPGMSWPAFRVQVD